MSKEVLADNEKISIIMAVFNCEKTLKESIDSILAQSYDNWEFIICDDCSTDLTFAIINEYKEEYPDKFIIIQNETNSKLAYSLNHCLKYATGKYVARMDGDDLSTPDRLEKQVEFLRNHPDVDLVGCSMQRFSESGMGMIDKKPEHPDKNTMKSCIPFNHATIMTYKRVYDSLNGYTVAKRTERGQDYDLWFRFFYEGFNGANMEEALYLVREDINAIKRRTFKVRWMGFQTTKYGYKLLGFPKYLIVVEALRTILKSLVPSKIVLLYRKWQSKK
ncbi:MAG: glycosyltransferase family 2 protein [Eubacterium sp.]|nr:glycosyltransferase family 2 protein [Eubacterium sp.]